MNYEKNKGTSEDINIKTSSKVIIGKLGNPNNIPMY
jgi:hypothetical protein